MLYSKDVLRMYQFVEKLSDIQAALEAHDGDTASLLKTNFAEPLSVLATELVRCLLLMSSGFIRRLLFALVSSLQW